MNLKKIKTDLAWKFPILQNISYKIKAKNWEKNSIVYYVGNRKDKLTPNSLKEGASGSYTALIYLCKEWAKLGRKVTVYSTCGENEAGFYDGVEYKNYYEFNPFDNFDTLIIFQHPYILRLPVKARKVCLEWQDILFEEKVAPREKLERFDIIFAKSHYQRKLMDFIPDSTFEIVSNGIDKNIAKYQTNKKEPYKLIYASRYYRGLESMLTYGWPIIKQEIPESELHIYYGWVRRENYPSEKPWKDKMIALMQQEGVFEHGKIGQDTLIQEKSTSSIHYYACTYEEIDCISVRESAMVGCVPVTTDYGVFSEKDYCLKVPGEPKAKETQEAIAHKIVHLLRNPQELEVLRQKFMEVAQNDTWDKIAKVWLNRIDS